MLLQVVKVNSRIDRECMQRNSLLNTLFLSASLLFLSVTTLGVLLKGSVPLLQGQCSVTAEGN